MTETAALPMQPIGPDDSDVMRFQSNLLVRFLLDTHPTVDMNVLARLPNIPHAHREQFAQLIGYSVCGFGELSYASDEMVELADLEVERQLTQKTTEGT